jgi:glycosyltransferase involved in cell wall biosynthesis
MVQVLIATRRRPDYLRVALESVRAQSAVGRIGTVVVSENGGSRESEAICREFPDLPILYLFQEPELDGLAHARVLSLIDRHPYTAILHDDDWWTPCHLEVACRLLDAHTSCNAYFSSYLELTDCFPPQLHRNAWRVWAAAGKDFRPSVLVLDFVQVLVANLLSTSFHYSTLVARTDSFRSTIGVVCDSGNAYDNDRMSPVLLADPSGLIYSTIPTAVIRRHSAQDSVSDAHLRRDEIVVETTRWMQRRWPSQCQEAARYFNAAVQDIGEEKLRLVTGAGADLLRSFLAQEIGFTMWMEPETRVSRLKKRLPVGVKAALRTSLRLLRLRR